MEIASVLKSALVICSILSLMACSPSGSGERAVRASTGNGTVVSAGGPCGAAAGVIGRVFDADTISSSMTFEERVKGLISGDYDPQYIGTVMGLNGPSATCVTLEGQLRFDSAGSIVIAQSTLSLKVYDSLANKPDTTGAVAGSYPIAFTKAESGQKSTDGSFTVTFSDSVGKVTLEGRAEEGRVVGQIRYENVKHFNGGSPVTSELGAFAINTASFLK